MIRKLYLFFICYFLLFHYVSGTEGNTNTDNTTTNGVSGNQPENSQETDLRQRIVALEKRQFTSEADIKQLNSYYGSLGQLIGRYIEMERKLDKVLEYKDEMQTMKRDQDDKIVELKHEIQLLKQDRSRICQPEVIQNLTELERNCQQNCPGNQENSETTTVISSTDTGNQENLETTTVISTTDTGNQEHLETTTVISTTNTGNKENSDTTTVMSTTDTGHYGSSFWIAFPTVISYSNRKYIKIKLTVLSSSAVSTTISIATSTSHYLTDAANKSIDLPYTLIEDYNIVEDKGMLVTTNTSASVYAFSYHHTANYISDMSWVPSSDRLGTSYIAISYHPASYHAYINIVSIYPSTIVNVTLNTTGGVTYNGSIYTNGDMLTLYLNQYNSIQVTSDKDITGSKIESNLPIMVQSGMSYFWGPKVAGCFTAASIYEVPVPAWGRTFIVPPIQTALRYAIRIVPSKQSTLLSVRSNHTVNTYTLSSTLELNFNASEMLVIKCNDPCFVAQYPASKGDYSVTSYMVTVPAVEQYSRDFNMISPDVLPYKSHFISVMIKSGEDSGLLLNGTTVYNYNVNVQSITKSNNTWSVLSITVPHGTHKVTHTSTHTVYGVIGYGFGYCISYGYVAGLNI